MKLTKEELEILDGSQGNAKQRAMELLVKYGEALGAEKFVEVTNVTGGIGGSPQIRNFADQVGDMDAVFSEFKLNSNERVEIPRLEAFSTALTNTMDPLCWKIQNATESAYKWGVKCEDYSKTIDMHCAFTCAPYVVGIMPVFGEHCAWMESSAISFCNSVIGGRTNTEGLESTGAAALVKRIPYWGLHIKENRYATHQIDVKIEVDSNKDWGLLGYYFGKMVQEKVPVINGIGSQPNLIKLKHCCAAAASSGGVEMYHIAGKTPEAKTLEEALGNKKPLEVFPYGEKERKEIYEHLNSGNSEDVDFVVLGCPHGTLEEIWQVVRFLDGRKINGNSALWIFVPRAIKDMADRQGYTEIIEKAGGHIMADTCPAMAKVFPKGTKTAATNSAKQAHYFPSLTGIGTFYGSTKECIEAAVSGKWRGEL
ncbi:aconitase X [Maledivibacter halophilus]|uniref:Predicted aconitase subunit 1 n=1 Tax=Maledivibacter halophilus TaxID=36842 RepID=A0A1T5M2D8_9FIRM|nr:aconitase X catalytic domain-containing protein [Maledivibacter halophilus]SKC82323.1 predicted aconitase subunit 1 [Maledivibacter halophilus]